MGLVLGRLSGEVGPFSGSTVVDQTDKPLGVRGTGHMWITQDQRQR